MEKAPFRIDVHHHFMPDVLYDALDEVGALRLGGSPTTRWTVEQSFDLMEKFQIKTSLLDISNPALYPIYQAQPEKIVPLARSINESMAELHEKYPKQFGGKAILPLPFVDESLKELEYALDVLKLDGLGLLSNYGLMHLGDPEMDALFYEMNKRKTALFIHPAMPSPTSWRAKYLHVDSLLEFPTSTARAAANLIFSGTVERYPDVQIILAHAGGTLPYLKFRFDEFQKKYTPLNGIFPDESVQKGWQSLTKTASEYMAKFWYDNCTSTDRNVFETIKSMAGEYRFVFGSDMMFVADFIRQDMVDFIESFGFTEEEKNNIEYGYAAEIFPRFK